MSVVKNGMMYFTAPPNVLKVDARTGKTVWRFSTGGTDGGSTPPRGGTPAMGAPDREGAALGEGLVFVGLSDARVIALRDDTGELVWNRYVGEDARDKGQGIAGAPVYAGGIVSVGLSADNGWRGQVVGLEAQDRPRGLALVRRAGAGRAGQRHLAEDGPVEVRWRGHLAGRCCRRRGRSRLLRAPATASRNFPGSAEKATTSTSAPSSRST